MNEPGKYGFDEEQEFFYTPQGEEMYHTDVVEMLNGLSAVVDYVKDRRNKMTIGGIYVLVPVAELNEILAALPEKLK